MNILVANLGSTSFKYKLYDLGAGRGRERLLAQGGVERVGSDAGRVYATVPAKVEQTAPVPDHAAAIAACLAQLQAAGAIAALSDVHAVGFKAVHGGPISGAVRVDERVLATMQEFAAVAPAHNPMYVAAMKGFARQLPGVPLVACFETAFHQTMPARRSTYAIPWEWTTRLGVRRYGFHGASHRYIAERTTDLLGRADARVISCHLGGSSSICAIAGGRSVANSFGIAPQSGLPHNNRVGDFDAFAIMKLQAAGLSLEQVWAGLSKQGGLQGISGVSNDLRDIEAAATGPAGETRDRAELAIGVLVTAVCDYVGAYLMDLGGADAIVLTGGIGENSRRVQGDLLARLAWLGVKPAAAGDPAPAAACPLLPGERRLTAPGSTPAVWVVPTNEELVVARQTQDALRA